MRDIGKNIRDLRIQKHMTQDELAEKLFVTRQTVSNYETGRSRPDVEMLAQIAETLETDVNRLIYGCPQKAEQLPFRQLAVGCSLLVFLLLIRGILGPLALEYQKKTLTSVYGYCIVGLIDPLLWLCGGWTLMLLVTMALRKPALPRKYSSIPGKILILLLVVWLLLTLFFVFTQCLDEYLYYNKLRGQWVDFHYLADGKPAVSKAWERIPLPIPQWLNWICRQLMWRLNLRFPWVLSLPGALLMLCGFPGKKKT